jgi:hypothetical protein
VTDLLDDRIRSLMVLVVEATTAAEELEEIMYMRLSTEPNPAVAPLLPQVEQPRRRWLVAVAAATAVLVVLGGASLLLRATEPSATTASVVTETATDPSVVSLSPSGWSRIPIDESAFGAGASLNGVVSGGPGLVAVGSDDLGHAVWTSPDGVTWSRVPHDTAVFGDAEMERVIAGGPGFVAIGNNGHSLLDGSFNVNAVIWTSVDGYTWSRVPHDESVFGGAFIEAVTVGGPGLVAVGGTGGYNTDGDAVVWTSVDGVTWSRVPHDESVFGGVNGQFMSNVTVGGPGLVAVGSGGGIGPWDHSVDTHAAVWTSVDGTTWSRVPDDDALLDIGATMMSVAAGGPGLVAVGSDWWPPDRARTPVWTSPDGITWTRVPDDEAVRGVMFDVIAGGPGLVAVGCVCGTVGEGSVVWTSVDGITWTPDDRADRRPGDIMRTASIQGPYLVIFGTHGSNTEDREDEVVWVVMLEELNG